MAAAMRQVVRNANLFDSAAGLTRPRSTIVADGDPAQGLGMLAKAESGIRLLMKSGRILRSTI
jgi:hypothetical protein